MHYTAIQSFFTVDYLFSTQGEKKWGKYSSKNGKYYLDVDD